MLSIAVTCPVELERALELELRALGVSSLHPGKGVIEVEGDLALAYRLLLWSRVANRVLLPIARVPLEDGEQFYSAMKALAWENWCEAKGSMAIQWTLASGQHHGQFYMYRLKDAICDRFREQGGVRPDVDTETPGIVFHLLLQEKEAAVFLDLGGGSLHARGYRVGRGQAPLKENLAAALLLLAESQAADIVFDPLCGSGTLLIEAALMQADRAPGLLKPGLACPGWLGHDLPLWKMLSQEALDRSAAARKKRDEKIAGGFPKKTVIGFDADRDAVAEAIVAADRAGVSDWIHVERRDLGQLAQWPRWPQLHESMRTQKLTGLVITNPPYGERLGTVETVPWLYRSLARALQASVPGWRLALLAGSKEQARACDVETRAVMYRQRVHNGPIGCDFSVSTIAGQNHHEQSVQPLVLDGPRYDRALTALQKGNAGDLASSLLNRLRKNSKALQKWLEQSKTECYRLYDADIPELNVAIDIYRQHLHVQEYAAPSSVNEQKASERFAIVRATLEIIFPDAAGIHCKVRRRQKSGKQYERHDDKQAFIEVQEGAARLLVNLDDYLDSGLFLDHRPMRLKLAEWSREKRFLNLFCYTGAATIHAAVGGAKSSVSVDLSPTYLQWARANLALNGLGESSHRFVQADVMSWLPSCRDQFDLIFVDPPTFSNSKRTQNDFDVQEHHAEMIDLLMRRLEPGGKLVFSNNFRRFVLDESLKQRYRVEDITKDSIPADFALHQKGGKPIHRCWLIQRAI